MVLWEMDVHLITIEISVIGFTVSVMHPDGLLFWKHSGDMSLDGRLMKSWLSVHEQWVARQKVSVHSLVT